MPYTNRLNIKKNKKYLDFYVENLKEVILGSN